jgi:hypothetical protein
LCAFPPVGLIILRLLRSFTGEMGAQSGGLWCSTTRAMFMTADAFYTSGHRKAFFQRISDFILSESSARIHILVSDPEFVQGIVGSNKAPDPYRREPYATEPARTLLHRREPRGLASDSHHSPRRTLYLALVQDTVPYSRARYGILLAEKSKPLRPLLCARILQPTHPHTSTLEMLAEISFCPIEEHSIACLTLACPAKPRTD